MGSHPFFISYNLQKNMKIKNHYRLWHLIHYWKTGWMNTTTMYNQQKVKSQLSRIKKYLSTLLKKTSKFNVIFGSGFTYWGRLCQGFSFKALIYILWQVYSSVNYFCLYYMFCLYAILFAFVDIFTFFIVIWYTAKYC